MQVILYFLACCELDPRSRSGSSIDTVTLLLSSLPFTAQSSSHLPNLLWSVRKLVLCASLQLSDVL